MKIFILATIFCIGSFVQANERFLPAALLIKMGYNPFKSFHHYIGIKRGVEDTPHNLQWPVQFQDSAHSIAQNYVNFQDYGSGAYFHKGCDLRAEAGSWVTAPITGVLEAGYYSYTDNPDGSEVKMWKPWNGRVHDDPYFELALVTPDGHRFEFHHVDSMNLPQSTIDALNKGGVSITAGTQIGHVIHWPGGEYNHIHYNIFRQDNVIENPEAVSMEVPDHIAPSIHGVYGIRPDGSVIELQQRAIVQGPLAEIVVATTETRDNSVYVQTPPFVGIKFATGETTFWDFRNFLLGPDNKWPDIRNVFLQELETPRGQRLTTFGQYGEGLFLMRLKLPTASGAFSIKVGDTAGNFSTFEGVLENEKF